MPLRLLLRGLFLWVVLTPVSALAQDISGIWRGYFITDMGEQYKYELQIGQAKSSRISGVSYSYLDTRFYGKATLTGSFLRSSKSALIQEIRTVEVKMAGGSTACIMKCSFVYTVSGKEQFLEGTYTSIRENEPNKGGDCGGGRVILRKVPSSDFYVEPFLRNKIKSPAPPVQKPPVQKPPVQKPATPRPAAPKPAPKPAPARPSAPQVKKDTVQQRKPQVLPVPPKPENKPVVVARPPAVTRSRSNELVKTLEVHSDEIEVRLYDNGEIDGDTISVYLDGKAVVSRKGLSTEPIVVRLKMDEASPEHTLVMVAENFGRIPPNTSLMIVQDGDNRHQVSITSTEQKNAMVRFRYQK